MGVCESLEREALCSVSSDCSISNERTADAMDLCVHVTTMKHKHRRYVLCGLE